jgi:hypothetical protein
MLKNKSSSDEIGFIFTLAEANILLKSISLTNIK